MTDDDAMQLALDAAARAGDAGDVPVGAVILLDGEVLSVSFNEKEAVKDPTAHAEMIAIREAVSKTESWRLAGATLVVTLEPCVMCAGALSAARVGTLVFGAYDPKAGAVGSLYNIADDPRLNHRIEVRGGVRAQECGELLSSFFQARRKPVT